MKKTTIGILIFFLISYKMNEKADENKIFTYFFCIIFCFLFIEKRKESISKSDWCLFFYVVFFYIFDTL